MTILFFGIYDPQYPRNRVLMKALRLQGITILECRTSPKKGMLLRLAWNYLRMRPRYDVMLVGFSGHIVIWLARLLTRKPIVLDIFTSHYLGYVFDRKHVKEGSWKAKLYYFMDRWACKLADLALLDTNAHIDYFVSEFRLARSKFLRVFVGTDTSVFYPRPRSASGIFKVHFHGHYIPVHGVRHIIDAARLLVAENIQFTILGNGQTSEVDQAYAKSLGIGNIRFLGSVPYEELPSYIAEADVTLGLFGDTKRIELSIPNKTFESLASKRAVITADTSAVHELLTDRNDVLLCKVADPGDLARAIMELYRDPPLKDRIAQGGYETFMKYATEDVLGELLVRTIREKFALYR